MKQSYKLFLKKFSSFHRAGSKPDVFIFTAARSGSTFLMELLQSQDGIKVCSEPLNIRVAHIKKQLEVNSWGDLLPGPQRQERVLEYFQGIAENKITFFNQHPFKRGYRFFTSRIVYKVLHSGHDMITEIRKKFDAKIIYLLRHPIAVTLSREEYPRLYFFLLNNEYRKFFSAEQIALAEKIITNDDPFEHGILDWCFQNYPALNAPDRINWLTVTYEEIITNPEAVSQVLTQFLDLDHPERIANIIRRPSLTVSKSDAETKKFFDEKQSDHKWLIRKWRKRISEQQLYNAFEILHTFNIEVYSPEKDMPSKKYLVSEV